MEGVPNWEWSAKDGEKIQSAQKTHNEKPISKGKNSDSDTSESDNEDEYADWNIEWMVILPVIIL